jgi:hypothetical protein
MHFSAWVACLSTNPAYHIAAHHAAFATMHLQGAIAFAVLRMRNAARSSAWQALHLTLTFSRLAVF